MKCGLANPGEYLEEKKKEEYNGFAQNCVCQMVYINLIKL